MTAATTLRSFAVDAAGNRSAVQTWTYQLSSSAAPCPCATQGVTLKSEAGLDGWISSMRAWGGGADRPKVGDRGMFQQDLYRGVLSFTPGGQVPAGAQVVGLTLRLRRQGAEGADALTGLVVDLAAGHFGASPGVSLEDYRAAATLADAARLPIPRVDGEWIEVDLPRDAFVLAERGTLQVRLRALSKPRFAAAQLVFFGGEDGQSAPELIVRYQR